MKSFRRRNFLIDRNLQFRIIAASVGYVAFYIIMMAIATFAPVFMELRSAYPGSYRAYLLANSFLHLHRYIWPAAILIIVLVSIHALFFSHKMAGPMYRFRQIFLSLTAGKIPVPQRLRKGDYLQPEMKLINEMLDSLRSKVANIQDTQKAIAGCITEIVKKSRALSDKELSLLVENLDTQGKRLAEYVLLIEKEP
ncbi:MAG: methyl-accepting chemotaxis protein [Acidobacteria bacterium]|nr:methyl-accepting chemotaxis protein [Acidobacteriota bacterium]